jgi:hypothetical protein
VSTLAMILTSLIASINLQSTCGHESHFNTSTSLIYLVSKHSCLLLRPATTLTVIMLNRGNLYILTLCRHSEQIVKCNIITWRWNRLMKCCHHYLFLQPKCHNNVNVKTKVDTAYLYLPVFMTMLRRLICLWLYW